MLAATLAIAGEEPFFGTWILNVAQSKVSVGPAPTSGLQVLSKDGDWIVARNDVTNADGTPVSYTIRYRHDGKPYPIATPNIGRGTITVKKIDDHHYEWTVKGEGKYLMTSRSVISKDGNTRTVTQTGTNRKGEPSRSTYVYQRQ
jgi:hypothetical protein